MNLSAVEALANAVLYEGYILYPYRPSSIKNQKRFNFGVLVPPAFSAAEKGTEADSMQTECLLKGNDSTTLTLEVRFLQPASVGNWMEAVERVIGPIELQLEMLADLADEETFDLKLIQGRVSLSTECLGGGIYRLTVRIANETLLPPGTPMDRDHILPHSCASTHTILAIENGEFVSSLDPPEELREAAAGCHNIGTWPILAGEPGLRNLILSSPIILYDYAEVAPESPGDLYDGGEIDEILSLRILTLTDDEKREMRESNERARRILERTESLSPEHLMKLHGVLRELPPDKGGRK